jgi:hypothetical protein
MAYLALTLYFGVLWVIAFFLRRDLRRSLTLFSLAVMPLGPISEIWFLQDYWSRQTFFGARIGLDDALFSFFMGGVAFAIYKVAFGVHLRKTDTRKRALVLPLVCGLITLTSLIILTNMMGINSIFSSALSFCLIACLIWFLRPDLVGASIASGAMLAGIFALGYAAIDFLFPGTLQLWCLDCNPTHVRVFGINIEELIWDFCWGLVGGVAFEATTGREIVRGDAIT